MLKSIIKKFICAHKKTILINAIGEGENTVFVEKCLCCGHMMTDTIKVKTK